jgi:nitronate monooxygenase
MFKRRTTPLAYSSVMAPKSGNELLQRLQLQFPIIQAPMAGVSTPAMAAAVSNAGALGSMGVGATNAGGAAKMIRDARGLCKRALNINVFCHRPATANPALEAAWIERLRLHFTRFDATPPTGLSEIYESFVVDDAMLEQFIQLRPEVVSFHFGLPSADRLQALRKAGIVLIASVTSLDEANAVVAAGVDAVVAQGYEAGGHRGVFDPDAPDDCLGTFALTRMLVRNLDVPVIATGGIMDGAGIAAVLKLGAVAAQLGTAFVGCPESSADAGYRAALESDAAFHTVMTRAISGRMARCLTNQFTKLGESVSPREIPAYPIAYDAGKALHAAAKAKSEFGYGAQWAGQAAPLARSLPSADLVRALVAELEAARGAD